jgi:hypothetical protein
MSANWDVDELEAKKTQILEEDLLRMDLKGEFGNSMATKPTYTTILYPKEKNSQFNMDYFLEIHMPLVVKHWGPYGLVGYDVVQFHATDEQELQFTVQCTLKWSNPESVKKMMQSPEAKIV